DTLVPTAACGGRSFVLRTHGDKSVPAPSAAPSNGFSASARSAISDAVAEMKREQIADRTVFKENLRIHLKRFLQRELGTKPVIVTTIVEV
ncbi:MAG: hypothetical protein ACRD6X_18575, partial [Pyrinomonadaceae bacterium]